MRKIFLNLFLVLVVFLGLGGINIFADNDESDDLIPAKARKIVVFRQGVDIGERNATLRPHGAKIRKHFSLVNATSVVLLGDIEAAKARILRDPRVERIEDDFKISLIRPTGLKIEAQASQTTPWNISRINAPLAWATGTGAAVKVAIVDTGIQLDHPDLQANIKGGINTINPNKTPNDDNGHGTHVAGIVAAINNSIGVVGVSPQAYLYAVKVLNAAGSGWLSDIIEGLEWCIAKGMDVANMSFGASSGSQLFHDAITNAYNAGIVLVAAAGNDGGPTLYPAAYNEVIAVAASDSSNKIPYWSNVGKIDFTAPGVSIYSTYKGSKYMTLSGTSMASPHVVGVCALLLQLKPAYSPSQVYTTLKNNANLLSGYNSSQQGNGLVDAYKVVTNP